MQKLFTAFIFLLAFGLTSLSAQSRRYFELQFDSIRVDTGLVYGRNYSFNSLQGERGLNQIDLTLDIYSPPIEDTLNNRPMIIWAHGGSFLNGTKNDADIVYFCNEYAKRGFVCASINYRLGYELPIDSVNAVRAVYRALQDGRAAVRYIRSRATELGIDPDRIYFGGTSAGAFIASNIVLLNRNDEIPSYVDTTERGLTPNSDGRFALDGLEGKTNNINESSNVAGVINYCGATRFVSWMDDSASASVPFISMHGTEDGTVPYGTRVINLNDLTPIPSEAPVPIIEVMGSYDMDKYSDKQDYKSRFYTWYGADHVPYIGTDSTARAYMDTVMSFTLKYVYEDFLGLGQAEGLEENEAPCDFNNGVTVPCSALGLGRVMGPITYINIFPNPSRDKIKISGLSAKSPYRICNQLGQTCLQGEIYNDEIISLEKLIEGNYTIVIQDNNSNYFYNLLKQ